MAPDDKNEELNTVEDYQREYDDLLDKAEKIKSEITKIYIDMDKIRTIVPELSEKLALIQDTKQKERLGQWDELKPYYDEFLDEVIDPRFTEADFTESEKKAFDEINQMWSQISDKMPAISQVRQRLQDMLVEEQIGNIHLKRNIELEVNIGILKPESEFYRELRDSAKQHAVTSTQPTSPIGIVPPRDVTDKPSRPGRKADPNVARRTEIVRKHMKERGDYKNPEKIRALFSELDSEGIQLPEGKGPPSGTRAKIKMYKDLLEKPENPQYRRTLDTLRRGLYPKK